jgi:hypothetical protein
MGRTVLVGQDNPSRVAPPSMVAIARERNIGCGHKLTRGSIVRMAVRQHVPRLERFWGLLLEQYVAL